ncbi:hypothetical protein F5B20DRAFT_218249 [Whalleya microplaca]|nr:hypothetical protein F5B20DRAFT_218249 [Whalleya microplaca]
MWFRPLGAFLLLSAGAFCQDDSLPGPGQQPGQYTDGSFSEPKASQSTYRLGSTMNVSWTTTYETSNLWLIVNWSFNSPVQLASNLGQTWYEWKVSTDSRNSSDIYAFRIVNATGTDDAQKNGGFLSAAFWIDGLASTSLTSSTTASTLTTSATAPIKSTEAATTSDSTPIQTTSNASESQSGLSEGGKVGVGVGVGVGALGFIALLAGIWFWRRSRKGKVHEGDSQEPYAGAPGFSQPPHTLASTPETYVGTPIPQPYNEYYKPEMDATSRGGSELDGGQGHVYTPEAYSDSAPRQHLAIQRPAELQG